MKKSLLIIFIGFFCFSCEDYLDEAFKNPNNPTEVTVESALVPIAANMARGIQFDSRFAGRYVQYWVGTTSGDSFERLGYTPNSDNSGEKWRTHYFNFGQNLINLIRDARKEGKNDYIGVAYANFAWSWLNLTDYHGDVILKQAFDVERYVFEYDTQQEVYKHVLALCDSATVYLDKGLQSPTATLKTADRYLYAGDLAKWKKFVNGVRAKTLHRYSLKSSYKPDDVIKAVDAAFVSVDDDATVKFDNGPVSAEEANFFGPRRNNMAAIRQSNYVIRLMDGTIFDKVIDPRMAYFFRPSTDGRFRGIVVNAGEATTLPAAQKTYNFWGAISTGPATNDNDARTFFKNNAPLPIMTLSELQFIKTEAAFLKGDKATALIAYKKGIQSSFDLLRKYTGYTNFTDKQVSDYITAVSPKEAKDLTINQIMLQKYLALWGYGFEETWVDMRRYKYNPEVYTGYTLPNQIYPDNLGKLVYRVRPRYNSEYLWNVSALRKVGGLDPDYHTKECWFSIKE